MAFKSKAEIFGDGGGFGPAVPVSTSNGPGTNATNRGIQFGEQVTAAIGNRPSGALADNTDELNTRVAVFETDGLDAAYRLGAAAVAGGGRVVTKDGGAIETQSAMASQRDTDIANAHLRAVFSGDLVNGGVGLDVAGFGRSGVGNHLASLLDRRAIAPNNDTILGTTVNVTLNSGGTDPDGLTIGAGQFSAGSNNDLILGYDMVQVLSGAHAGVYIITNLVSSTVATLMNLDGTSPSFGSSVASTARFFRPTLSASSRYGSNAAHLHQANMMSGVPGQESALDLIAGATYGRLETSGASTDGARHALRVLQRPSSGIPASWFEIDAAGSLSSRVSSDSLGSSHVGSPKFGIPAFLIEQPQGTGSTEVGVVAKSVGALTDYFGALVVQDQRTTGVPTGVVNFTFKTGNIVDFADVNMADTQVAPGVSLIEIITPTAQAGIYKVSVRTANDGELTLTPFNGGALSLPTSGSGTARVLAPVSMGRRTLPATVASYFGALGTNGSAAMMAQTDGVANSSALVLAGDISRTQNLIRGLGTEDGGTTEYFRLTALGELFARKATVRGDVIISDASSDYEYSAERLRKITINLHDGLRLGASDWSYPASEASNYMLTSGSSGAHKLVIPLNNYLRHGQRLVSLKMSAKPGSDPGVGDRLRFGIYRSAPLDFSAPGTAPTTPTLLFGAECTGAVQSVFSATAGGTIIAVRDNTPSADSASDYWIQITSTNDVVSDEIYGLELEIGETIVRNN